MNDYLAENKKRIELEYIKRKEKHEELLRKAESALGDEKDDEALRHLSSAIEQLKGLQRKKAS